MNPEIRNVDTNHAMWSRVFGSCVILIGSVTLSCCSHKGTTQTDADQHPEHLTNDDSMFYANYATTEVLKKIILPRVEFTGLTLDESCQFLANKVSDCLQQVEESPLFITFEVESKVKEQIINISTKDISVFDLMRKMESDCKLKVVIQSGVVHFGHQ